MNEEAQELVLPNQKVKPADKKDKQPSIKNRKVLWIGLLAVCASIFAISFVFGERTNIKPSNTPWESSQSLAVTESPTLPTSSISPSMTEQGNNMPAANRNEPTTPSVTNSPTPPPTNTPVVTPTYGNFGGHWIHNFGTMDLTQSGPNVTGTYYNSFINGTGRVSGVVSGNILHGTWQMGGSGTITWVLNNTGNAFTGNWNNSNGWCGARSGVALPDGCSFAGAWIINIPGVCPTGAMQLAQTGTSVSGTYCNGTLSGNISYSGSQTILSGSFHTNSGVTNNLTFYLPGYNSLQFQGDDTSGYGAWCGWRNRYLEPSPCKK